MNKSLAAFAAAVLAIGLSGCNRMDSGPMTSQTRNLDEFDSIEVEGAVRLEVRVGQPQQVVVQGHEQAVTRVETEVRGDTLRIKNKPRDSILRNSNSPLIVTVSVPALESLELEGGNDVNLEGFAGGKTRIKAAGAANIEAQGFLDELRIRLSGAGHADLSRLIANEAKVTVDGVGSVIVNPKETLDATMNGVGAILYTGSPRRVNTRMNGLGTIAQRDRKDTGPEPEIIPPKAVDPEELQPEYEEPAKKERKVKADVTEVI